MQRSNVTSYTVQQLDKLWSELAGLPAKIQASKDDTVRCEQELGKLRPQLEALNKNEIAPVLTTIDAIKARKYVLTLPAEISALAEKIKVETRILDNLGQTKQLIMEELAPVTRRIAELEHVLALDGARQSRQVNQSILENEIRSVGALDESLHREQGQICSLAGKKSELESSVRKVQEELRHTENARIEQQRLQQAQAAASSYESSQPHVGAGYESSPQQPTGYSSSPQRIDENNEGALRTKISELQDEIDCIESDIKAAKSRELGLEKELDNRKAGIERLRDTISKLEKVIDEHVTSLAGVSYSLDINQVQRDLQKQLVKHAPIESRRVECEQSIKSHESEKLSLESQYRGAHNLYLESVPKSKPYEGTSDIKSLDKLLEDNIRIRDGLKRQRDTLQGKIDTNEKQIRENNKNISVNERRKKELENNNFLMNYHQTPAKLLSDLFESFKQKLADFEWNHPAGLSSALHIALFSMQPHADFIMHKTASAVDEAGARIKLIQLSGLIYTVCDELKADAGSKEFIDMLNSILGKDVIAPVDAKSAYLVLKQQNKENLRDATESELINREVGEYHATEQRFDDLVHHCPKNASYKMKAFYNKGVALLNGVVAEKTEKTTKGGKFDYRLHNEILKTACAMLQNPEQPEHHQRLAALAQHNKNGLPSVAKKVFGAIMMFIGGAALLVGGLILGKVLPGVSWPVAAGLMTIGGGLFAGGLALLANGRKKGVAKALDNFDAAAVNAVKVERKKTIEAHRAAGSSLFTAADVGLMDPNDDVLMRNAPLAK